MNGVTLHHYLHNQGSGTIECERLNEHEVECCLAGFNMRLPVDCRDQRNLLVFDGLIPYGALPRSATVIDTVEVGRVQQILIRNAARVRNDPAYPFVGKPDYFEVGKDKKAVTIFRHFILLPCGRAVVLKFRDDSLSPVYVIIESSIAKSGKGVIEWRTTSY